MNIQRYFVCENTLIFQSKHNLLNALTLTVYFECITICIRADALTKFNFHFDTLFAQMLHIRIFFLWRVTYIRKSFHHMLEIDVTEVNLMPINNALVIRICTQVIGRHNWSV